uniref:Uncharacterized protein n=2 Tax=Sus scrofa TaxID=9823 RepID=A0A8D1A2U7_PIG
MATTMTPSSLALRGLTQVMAPSLYGIFCKCPSCTLPTFFELAWQQCMNFLYFYIVDSVVLNICLQAALSAHSPSPQLPLPPKCW